MRGIVVGLLAASLSVAGSACTALGDRVANAPARDGGSFDARGGDAHAVAPPPVHFGAPDAGTVEHLQGVDGGGSDGAAPPTECVPVTGAGDLATCPTGDVVTFLSGVDAPLCCPCTAADCGNAVCCGASACAGDSRCWAYRCAPLPASCGGLVDADCDDFPEDCDEPCCPCTSC